MSILVITGIEMKKIKIGQIGRGGFGNKILSKLKKIPHMSIEWVYGSKDKWWESNVDLGWVIIASPNEFHYEQSKHYLKKGVNVFCEKPGTLSNNSLLELINLSIENNVCFYVDDVLTYENILPINNFIYKKWGGLSVNIIDRMAYHHFYLTYDILESVDKEPTNINVMTNELTHKIFEVEFGDSKFKYEYDFGWFEKKIHNITSRFSGDAL